MNIEELRQNYIKEGYSSDYAGAKVCQDIILKQIATRCFKNVTIKGGVVMQSISKNIRRATLDIDIDFMKYSLEDSAIYSFIETLNQNSDGIKIQISKKPERLHHQDYDGKRVYISISDSLNHTIQTKLDIGVHKNFDVKQETYCFDLSSVGSVVTLFINSAEQIFIEKLKSLLKFGVLTTRFKDIFDFYYLINNLEIDKNRFNDYLNFIIYSDSKSNIKDGVELNQRINDLFSNKFFLNKMQKSKGNWINCPIEEVLKCIQDFLKSFETVDS